MLGSFFLFFSFTLLSVKWKYALHKTKKRIKKYIFCFFLCVLSIVILICFEMRPPVASIRPHYAISFDDIIALLREPYTTIAGEKAYHLNSEGVFIYVEESVLGSFVGFEQADKGLHFIPKVPAHLLSDYAYQLFFYALETNNIELLTQSIAEFYLLDINISYPFLCEHLSGYLVERILDVDFGLANSWRYRKTDLTYFIMQYNQIFQATEHVNTFRQYEMQWFWEVLKRKNPLLYEEAHHFFGLFNEQDYRGYFQIIHQYHTPPELDVLHRLSNYLYEFGKYTIQPHVRDEVPFYCEGNPHFPDMSFIGKPPQRGFTERMIKHYRSYKDYPPNPTRPKRRTWYRWDRYEPTHRFDLYARPRAVWMKLLRDLRRLKRYNRKKYDHLWYEHCKRMHFFFWKFKKKEHPGCWRSKKRDPFGPLDSTHWPPKKDRFPQWTKRNQGL